MSEFNNLSEELLYAVKTNKETKRIVENLARSSFNLIEQQLNDDVGKKSFWINIYNAYFQILRKDHDLKKPEIYTEKKITIAGHKFSLDAIEHGILRRYRYKYSLGYFSNPFAPSRIKKMAVNVIDYRIHFALNCGAKSCPPIAFYTVKGLEQQLELATLSFLEGDTEVKENEKEVHITTLMKWFLKDFGGRKGIRKVLKQHLKKDFKKYKLIFKPYSWEEELDNYDENNFNANVY
ncbi:MAG: hypothetical protein ACJA0U_001019 [Salibacteraceae bacterium]|jgi:hypothetical protein